MKALRAFGAFWWDFIVGDDWRIAAAVIVSLGLTALVAAWWLLPLVVVLILTLSLLSAVGPSQTQQGNQRSKQ